MTAWASPAAGGAGLGEGSGSGEAHKRAYSYYANQIAEHRKKQRKSEISIKLVSVFFLKNISHIRQNEHGLLIYSNDYQKDITDAVNSLILFHVVFLPLRYIP